MADLGFLGIRVGFNLDEVYNGTIALSKELDGIGRSVDRQVASLDRLGERAKEIGAGLTAAITVPIAGIGLAVGKMAEDFELSMRKVTSLLGDDAAKSFQPLNDGVLALSKSMGIDAVGAANALYEAISAGIPKENALEFLEVASKAAIAGVTSTKVAVDGMTNVINAYGLSVSEASKVADAMFQGVNIGKMTFEQLSASIGKAAGTAADLKISYQELIAAAASITKKGFSASEAFTMEESAMKALIVPHKQMLELIEKTGAVSGVALIQAKGFEGALNAIRDAAGGSVEKLAAAYGRIEGLKASLALTGVNAKDAAKDLDEVANKAGAMGKAFDEINKSFSRQMETFMARVKALGIEIGTVLLPIGQDILKSLTPMLDGIAKGFEVFKGLPMPVKEAALALVALAAAAGPALYIIGGIATGIAAIAPAFAVAAAAIGPLVAAFADLGGMAITGFVGPLTQAQTAMLGFTAAAVALGAAVVSVHEISALGSNIEALGNEFGISRDEVLSFGKAFISTAADVTGLSGALVPMRLMLGSAGDWVGGLIQSLTTAGKFTTDFGEAAGGTARKFSTLQLAWSDVKTSFADINWWHMLSGPIGALNSAIEKFLEIVHMYKGQFPEMDAAAAKLATTLQSQVHAHDALSVASLKTYAAQKGMIGINNEASDAMLKAGKVTEDYAAQLKSAEKDLTQVKQAYKAGTASMADVAAAQNLVNAAMAKAHPEFHAVGIEAKEAAISLDQISKALENIGKGTEETSKEAKRIDSLNDSLDKLFKAYQQGKISLGSYSEASKALNDRLIELDKTQSAEADNLSVKLQESYGKSLDYLHSINGRTEEITNSIFSQIGSGALGFANSVVSGMSTATQEFTKMGVLFVNEAQRTTAAVGVAVATNIKQVFANLATLKDAFKDIGGTEADGQNQLKNIKARLDAVTKLYQDNATNLAGIQLVSDADMLRRQITSGEEAIATERKFGEAVTDSQIETLRARKVAWTNAHMDTEQAFKELHITTTQFYADELRTAQTALDAIKNSTLSSHQDILKGETDVYAAELAAQQANGDRVTAIQKEHLAKMQELSAQGMKTWVTQVDELAVDAGKAMAKGMDNIISSFLAGKLSLKKAWDEMLTELTNAFVKAFISPITKSIGDFLANSMSQLLGGKGFGGLLSSVKSVQSAIGGGTDDAGFAVSGAGSAIKSGTASNASGAASGTSSGGFGSAGSIIGIAGVAVSAAAGITAGLQMAHLISTAGKIETNTREISTVMWQTGAESIQGLTKDIRNVLLQMNDRLVDLRTALFDPVAQDLEAILAKLSAGISVGTGIAEAVTDGTGDTTGAVETGTAGVGAAIQTASQTAGEHLLALEKQLEDLNVEIVQTKTVLSADNKALADQLKKNGDKNDPLYLALKAKVDADNALIQKDTATATAVTTAIKGQQSAIANAEKGIVDATQAAAGGIVSSVENSGSNLTGTITQTNGEIINALGQTGSEAIAAQHEDTEALLQQLGMLGSDLTAASTITGNAYSDLKATIKGVSAQSLADQKAVMDRMAAEAAAAANMGLTSFEREFGVGGDWIKGTTGGVDDPNQYKGPSEFTPLAPMSNYTAPVTGPLVSPGMGRDFSNQYGYVAPDPRNSPVAGPSAEYSRTSKYPVQYATTGNVTVINNLSGPITNYDYAKQLGRDLAEQVTIATR